MTCKLCDQPTEAFSSFCPKHGQQLVNVAHWAMVWAVLFGLPTYRRRGFVCFKKGDYKR